MLREILQTEGFSTAAIVQHAKNERNIKAIKGQESVLTFALHVLPTGTMWDKVVNKTDENVYYVALTTAGDLTLVGGLYFKATSKIGKAVLITDVAVNGVGAGAAAYQYANSEEGKAAHAGEFVLRLAAIGLGANSLRLSNAKAKIGKIASEAQAIEKVAENAPVKTIDDALTQIDVFSSNQLISQFDTLDPPTDLLHGTRHSRSAFLSGIDVSAGGGQLGPGFYVTRQQAVAEWFARNWASGGAGPSILHMPVPESALSQLRILRLAEDSSEYLRMSRAWQLGHDIPADLRYIIDDFDAVEAPVFFGGGQGVQLKFNPRAQSFVDQYPFFFQDLR